MGLLSPQGYDDLGTSVELMVGADGSYLATHALRVNRGALTDEQYSELREHATAAVAESLREFSHIDPELETCTNQQNDSAYMIIVGETTRCATSRELGCIVPEEVTGEAKVHIDYFVSLFKELTSGL